MNKSKKLFLGILIGITIILLVSWGVMTDFIKLSKIKVTDFESCAQVSSVIMESYPRQCVYDGKTYVEEIEMEIPNEDPITQEEDDNDSMQTAMQLPEKEKVAIQEWITKNKLNPYGDPKDSVYAGGNPLFDESTGEYQSLYDYLLMMHPDKPWLTTSSKEDEEESETNDDLSDKDEPDTSVIGFAEVKQWDKYTDPYFSLDYPSTKEDSNNPFETSISKDNGYPVKIYNSDGFDFAILVANTKPSNYEICDEKLTMNNDKKVFLCHNQSLKYKEIYTRMKDSLSIN